MARKYAIFGRLYWDYSYFCVIKTTEYGNAKRNLYRFAGRAQE